MCCNLYATIVILTDTDKVVATIYRSRSSWQYVAVRHVQSTARHNLNLNKILFPCGLFPANSHLSMQHT